MDIRYNNNNNDDDDEDAPPPIEELDPVAARKRRPDLGKFLHGVLSEAQTFLLTTIPRTFKVQGKPRSSPPSTAKVQLLNRVIGAADEQDDDSSIKQQDEFWVCRRSVHADAPVDGTASWDEFRSGLLENHSENEMAYTPSLTGVVNLMEWPVQEEIDGGWKDVHMHGIIFSFFFFFF